MQPRRARRQLTTVFTEMQPRRARRQLTTVFTAMRLERRQSRQQSCKLAAVIREQLLQCLMPMSNVPMLALKTIGQHLQLV